MDSTSQSGNNLNLFTGTVVEDKEANSRIVKVVCTEITPPHDAKELKPITANANVDSGTDDPDASYSGSVEQTNVIEATWLDLDSNRVYPPDLVKGEQVFVVNYGDTDKYYWLSSGRDDRLRKPERYRISISDSDTVDKELTDDNTYTLEMDTKHHKHILIRTCKSNGEQFAYLIKIDAEEGTIRLCDDTNNEILIDSKEPRVLLRNNKGTLLDLIGEDLNIVAVRDATWKVGRQLTIDTPLLRTVNKSGKGVTKWEAHDLTVDVSKSYVVNGKHIGLNGSVAADHINTRHVRSEGYSSGRYGSSYKGGEVDTNKGDGTNSTNVTKEGTFVESDRHCAAWEQVKAALLLIADCLEQEGCGSAGAIRLYAESCRMPKNRGE